MGAAKEYLGKAIQEMFIVKKDAEVKRFLPSIKNMKIVSVAFRDPPPMTDWVIAHRFALKNMPVAFKIFNFLVTSLALVLIKIMNNYFPCKFFCRGWEPVNLCWVRHRKSQRRTSRDSDKQVRLFNHFSWHVARFPKKLSSGYWLPSVPFKRIYVCAKRTNLYGSWPATPETFVSTPVSLLRVNLNPLRFDNFIIALNGR